jgi:DNA-binding phage protein
MSVYRNLTEFRVNLANEVRKAMAAKRITRTALAEQVELSTTVVDSIRNAEGNPGINSVNAVCTALGIDMTVAEGRK